MKCPECGGPRENQELCWRYDRSEPCRREQPETPARTDVIVPTKLRRKSIEQANRDIRPDS